MMIYDVCIIGGGAAGLAVAASLDSEIKCCIVDKNDDMGRKLLATGGGRCNLTNDRCTGKEITVDFFRKIGLEIYMDSEGRYYPYSRRAKDVVDILKDKIYKRGTEFLGGYEVECVGYDVDTFNITSGKNEIKACKVVIAAGGKAAPQYGTTGDSYKIARSFGHNINRLYPVLTGINANIPKSLKGIRCTGEISLLKDNVLIKKERGEIQFTERGLSGICVMDISQYITAESNEEFSDALRRYDISLDFAPDFEKKDIETRESSFGIICRELSKFVDPKHLKCWRLPVTGVMGWKNAQATGGGVELNEMDMSSMESKLQEGLYIVGEALDVQGPCGGFNLQNAWETGIKAAQHINTWYVNNEI